MTCTRIEQGQIEIVLEHADVVAAVKEYIIKNFDPQFQCALGMVIRPGHLRETPHIKMPIHWYADPDQIDFTRKHAIHPHTGQLVEITEGNVER